MSITDDTQVNSHYKVYRFIKLKAYHHHSYFIGLVPNVNDIFGITLSKFLTQLGEFFRIRTQG